VTELKIEGIGGL